jgi:hypothetical protein
MSAGTPHGCTWAEGDPLLRAYHDEEWGVPEYDSCALWEKLTLDGFQAGLSWLTITPIARTRVTALTTAFLSAATDRRMRCGRTRHRMQPSPRSRITSLSIQIV